MAPRDIYPFGNNMGIGIFSSDRIIPVITLSGFVGGSQYYYTGDNTGTQANLTGFSAWVVILPTYPGVPTNDWQLIFGKTNSYTNKVGWSFVQFQGEVTFCVGGTFVRNDGLLITQQNALSTSSIELGKIQVIHGVIRNNVIYLYKNGVLCYTGFPTNSTTSTFLTTTRGYCFGSYSQPGSPTNYAGYNGDLITCGVSSSGLTDDQVETHYQSILNDVNSQAPNTINMFIANDAGSTWADTIGGLVATRIGSISPSSKSVPFYKRYNAVERIIDSDALLPPIPNAKVLFVGDSRTIGGTPHNSWRLGCYNMIVNDTRLSAVTFVGPVFNSAFPMGYYAGYGGTSFADFINGTNGPSTPSELISTYNPDVIVLVLGVNNLDTITWQTDFISLVLAYTALKPSLRFVFVDENNAKFAGTTRDSEMQAQNNWRWNEGYIKLSQQGIKFIRVPVYNLLTPDTTDFISDGFNVHPTEQGFQKMAQYVDNNNKGSGIAYGLLLALGYK